MIEQVGPLTLLADASGDQVAYFKNRAAGRIVGIKYVPGTIDTGADLVITGETSGIAILTKATLGTSTVWFFPLAKSSLVTTGADSAITEVPVFVLEERIKVVLDDGGNAGTGTITFYIDQQY